MTPPAPARTLLDSRIAELRDLSSALSKKYQDLKPDPPKSLQAESTLFASIITDPAHIPSVLARLSADDFTDPNLRSIYAAMGEMHRKGLAINGITLAAYLSASGILPKDGGLNLEQVPQRALPAAKIDAWVDLLRHFTVQRRYVSLGLAIIDKSLSYLQGDPPLDETLPPLLHTALPAAPTRPGRLSSTALQLSAQTFSGDAWLLEHLFVAGGLNLLAGEVASGKTFLALDLALAVASINPARDASPAGDDSPARDGGLAWDDRPTLHGPVLYFCLDCSPRTIQQRLLALCAGRGIPPPADLYFDFSPLNLADPGGLAFLRQALSASKACLVIFDVLARYMPGVDENSVSSVGPVMTALRSLANDTGCSILILHHYNKGAGYAASASQGLRVRGSIDIIAAMDAVVAVTVSGPRTAPRRILTPEKNRDLPESSGMSFSLVAGDRPTPNPSLKGGESAALRLSFAPLKPQSAPSVDLIPAALHVLQQAPEQPFTCRQIEAALHQVGLAFARHTLQNTLPQIATHPGVSIQKNGFTNYYRWDPPKS